MLAYLEALEDSDGTQRAAKLKEHAAAMRGRIRELSQKRYWEQFDRAPEVVVMFVPNDACLSAAFEKDGDLLEYAMQQKVLPTTPVTLLALLKTVAYGWQQHKMAENAREIAEQGRELHDRLGKFVEHFQRAGNGLENAVKAYNDAVGSLESRLFPAARRLKEMGAASTEVPLPATVDRAVRPSGQLALTDLADEE
jgi:DNA recombination protein RmuC